MLALVYLLLAIYLGDQLCRRFYRYVTVAHRCAAAVLVGLLLSSWFTYVVAWLFRKSAKPLIWADLCFFATAFLLIWILRRKYRRGRGCEAQFILPRPPGSALWDWATLGAFLVLVCWMMFATLNYKNGVLQIANNEWSDFGPNTAIIQSFAIGHNFPTQYPHFSGETIRYHFLFYFQAGNLSFLGLNLAWSLNLLSILTLTCMLALVMTLGQSLFNSRPVGRIGAALFFFHGTLSFVAFLRSQPSLSAAFDSIVGLKDFLPSGYPYRGELWGIWTQVVFLNQRHFASAVGILLLVLLFLIDRYRESAAAKKEALARATTEETGPVPAVESPPAPSIQTAENEATIEPPETLLTPLETPSPIAIETLPDLPTQSADNELAIELPEALLSPPEPPPPPVPLSARLREIRRRIIVFDKAFLFCGFLLGALPFWNALVFTACFAILAGLFVLFPCRKQMLGLGLVTALVAMPQLIILRAGGVKTATHSLLHWGYIVDPPSVANVLKYVGFSFGLKWSLVLVALAFAGWFHRRLFLVLCSLFAVTFCLQMSLETLANHKYLNIWLIIGNLFAAYGISRLWLIRPRWLRFLTAPIALLITAAIVLGGAIDLVPIHHGYFVDLKYDNDPLIKWVRTNTKPHDLFLSDRFVNHQILLAGRRLFYGWPSFSWGAGYDTTRRDEEYRQLFESTDPYQVFRLLKKNQIAYVAIDEGVRQSDFIRRHNEELYSLNFPKVWEDKKNEYASLVIYKVPETAPKEFKRPNAAQLQARLMNKPAVTMFQGGKGVGRGQFDFPRGLTVDHSGNVLVADTMNGRIQRFTAAGIFLGLFGAIGRNAGEFQEPQGMGIDSTGNIYVGDLANHRVQKLSRDGRFLAQWKGPDPGFYGPRDVWVATDDMIYVVDQGRSRIAKFNPNGDVLAVWGSQGRDDGQFDEPTAVAVDAANDRVYVADPHNQRIEVFDTNGKFITKWTVKEWQPTGWSFQDLIVDPPSNRLYVTSPTTDEVLIFDLAGTRVGELKAKPPDNLEGASGLALWNGKLYVLCTFADRVRQLDVQNP
jgi:DNA-binding beta-propeller fold protein YncE